LERPLQDLQKIRANAALGASRQQLDRAYRATTYRADWPDDSGRAGAGGSGASSNLVIGLRVETRCPTLDRWLRAHGADVWAYLTAANPRSEMLPAVENAARTAALRERLVGFGLPFLDGCSVADDGEWPPEESFLVAGLDPSAACRLAEEFGQNAFLAGRCGEPVSLCWTPLAPESG